CAVAAIFCYMLIGFDNLPNAGRSYRVTISDQSATGVDWQIADCGLRIADLDQVANTRQSGRPCFQPFCALAGWSELKQLILHDFRNRKTIVHSRPPAMP